MPGNGRRVHPRWCLTGLSCDERSSGSEVARHCEEMTGCSWVSLCVIFRYVTWVSLRSALCAQFSFVQRIRSFVEDSTSRMCTTLREDRDLTGTHVRGCAAGAAQAKGVRPRKAQSFELSYNLQLNRSGSTRGDRTAAARTGVHNELSNEIFQGPSENHHAWVPVSGGVL